MTGTAPILLRTDGLCAGYGEAHPVLRDISLTLRQGDIIGLIGPNGAGKTTLLRAIAGDLRPTQGHLEWAGRPIANLTRRERAQAMAYIPPSLDLVMPLSVREYISLGRTPYVMGWQPLNAADRDAIRGALVATDLEKLADRSMVALSEGERHRALLALGLAQEPQLLLLDEPTAHLDIRHAWRFMELIHDLHQREELTILLTSHDLNIAAAFCHRVVLLADGQLAAEGAPSDVLESSLLTRLYDHPITVVHEPGQPPRIHPQRLVR